MKAGVMMQEILSSEEILSSQELYMYLNDFRNTIREFDYSDLENVIFFNLEAVCAYIENIENNPFKRQYNELHKILDNLQPYLPFLSSKRARDFLLTISNMTNDQAIEQLKIEYTHKLRIDFINVTRQLTNENEWDSIVKACEEIRSRKEEVYLH